jgi:hypothetical protein
MPYKADGLSISEKKNRMTLVWFIADRSPRYKAAFNFSHFRQSTPMPFDRQPFPEHSAKRQRDDKRSSHRT